MDGKVKDRNTSGGSSEGKGDRAKGVEGGVGGDRSWSDERRRRDDGKERYGRDGSLTPVGRCFRTNLSSSAGMHPS